MNRPNNTGDSSFRNGLNHPFSSAAFNFKSEIIEYSDEVMKWKNNMIFKTFGLFFSKCTFLGFLTFFPLLVLMQFFSGSTNL